MSSRPLGPRVLQLIGLVGLVVLFVGWQITGRLDPIFVLPCWTLATGGQLRMASKDIHPDD
jgi:hypothetical protein